MICELFLLILVSFIMYSLLHIYCDIFSFTKIQLSKITNSYNNSCLFNSFFRLWQKYVWRNLKSTVHNKYIMCIKRIMCMIVKKLRIVVSDYVPVYQYQLDLCFNQFTFLMRLKTLCLQLIIKID